MISPLGVYVVLVQLVVLVWGNNPQTLRRETAQVFRLEGGISIAQSQLTVLVGAAIVFILLGLWLQKSRLGLEFRGLANNPTQMALLGYNTDSLRLLAFGIAGALSAIAGLMSAYDLGFNPYVGMHAMLLAIVATIIGGKNTFIGPIVGGLLLGVVRALAIWYVSASWQDAITFLILAVFLFLRPQGIIGKKERLEVTA
jgi:branched-chain amino acid transport system permease protein